MNPQSSKSGKSSLANLVAFNNSKTATVPPVLRDVGKLAAGVASVCTSASATGNPRNKCALQPGHSLMDWIRLGASGRDLTNVGPHAGRLSITLSDLEKHNQQNDAWLAIRGKVFNVTAYLPFHPGGPEELMRGVGKDATPLFDQIHPWVNYDQILQKCFIGRLVAVDPCIDTEHLFYGNYGTSNNPSKGNSATITPPKICVDQVTVANEGVASPTIPNEVDEVILLPKFDWIQKLNEINTIFYTKPFSNPLLEVQKIGRTINVVINFDGRTFMNDLIFTRNTEWPCEIKVNYETGKVEVNFRKTESGIWDNYGVLRQTSRLSGSLSAKNKYSFIVTNKVQVTCNIVLLEMQRTDGTRIVVPIGSHVRVFGDFGGEEVSRSYTGVPCSLFSTLSCQNFTTDSVCLMVKRYPDGLVSKYVSDVVQGDVLQLSKPLRAGFQLKQVEKREIFLMLAAGTGITPMFSMLAFLLERRIRKSQSITLLFWNKKERYIPFQHQFQDLAKQDKRFKVHHILSDPDYDWDGRTGRINEETVQYAIDEQLQNTSYSRKDIYVLVCGPLPFNELASSILRTLTFQDDQIHLFQG